MCLYAVVVDALSRDLAGLLEQYSLAPPDRTNQIALVTHRFLVSRSRQEAYVWLVKST